MHQVKRCSRNKFKGASPSVLSVASPQPLGSLLASHLIPKRLEQVAVVPEPAQLGQGHQVRKHARHTLWESRGQLPDKVNAPVIQGTSVNTSCIAQWLVGIPIRLLPGLLGTLVAAVHAATLALELGSKGPTGVELQPRCQSQDRGMATLRQTTRPWLYSPVLPAGWCAWDPLRRTRNARGWARRPRGAQRQTASRSPDQNACQRGRAVSGRRGSRLHSSS